MYSTDQAAFREILNALGQVFGKPVTDQIMGLYWDALRDQPIDLVKAMALAHTRYGKFFPKPKELRPKDDAPKNDTRKDAAFVEGEKRAWDNLEWERINNPQAWLARVRPKVTEMGLLRGMTMGEIEEKLQRTLREGLR